MSDNQQKSEDQRSVNSQVIDTGLNISNTSADQTAKLKTVELLFPTQDSGLQNTQTDGTQKTPPKDNTSNIIDRTRDWIDNQKLDQQSIHSSLSETSDWSQISNIASRDRLFTQFVEPYLNSDDLEAVAEAEDQLKTVLDLQLQKFDILEEKYGETDVEFFNKLKRNARRHNRTFTKWLSLIRDRLMTLAKTALDNNCWSDSSDDEEEEGPQKTSTPIKNINSSPVKENFETKQDGPNFANTGAIPKIRTQTQQIVNKETSPIVSTEIIKTEDNSSHHENQRDFSINNERLLNNFEDALDEALKKTTKSLSDEKENPINTIMIETQKTIEGFKNETENLRKENLIFRNQNTVWREKYLTDNKEAIQNNNELRNKIDFLQKELETLGQIADNNKTDAYTWLNMSAKKDNELKRAQQLIKSKEEEIETLRQMTSAITSSGPDTQTSFKRKIITINNNNESLTNNMNQFGLSKYSYNC